MIFVIREFFLTLPEVSYFGDLSGGGGGGGGIFTYLKPKTPLKWP